MWKEKLSWDLRLLSSLLLLGSTLGKRLGLSPWNQYILVKFTRVWEFGVGIRSLLNTSESFTVSFSLAEFFTQLHTANKHGKSSSPCSPDRSVKVMAKFTVETQKLCATYLMSPDKLVTQSAKGPEE
jgi:hypothetical protein